MLIEQRSFWWQDEALQHERRKFLQAVGPIAFHCCAATYNWDYGIETLRWIIDRPDCDKGTAITVFHDGSPNFFHGWKKDKDISNPYDTGLEDLLGTIVANWKAGVYKSYRYRPARTTFSALHSEDLPWPASTDLCAPAIRGDMLNLVDWSEGFPTALLDGISHWSIAIDAP